MRLSLRENSARISGPAPHSLELRQRPVELAQLAKSERLDPDQIVHPYFPKLRLLEHPFEDVTQGVEIVDSDLPELSAGEQPGEDVSDVPLVEGGALQR